MIPRDSRVVIVGAGPAGLAVGAVLRKAGIESTLLEQADCVGSRWHTHYERLHLHTSKNYSGLPFLPFPANYPTYPSRLQVIEYLESYAKHFQLAVKFNQKVVAIDFHNGNWETTTDSEVYRSQALVVATGLNEKPTVPAWRGQESFRGTILHSADYRNGEPYRGKRVLVIGFGNSGGEIAIDLWEHGASPSLAVRGPVNVVFRDLYGIPTQVLSILLDPLPSRISDALTALSRYIAYGDITKYGLQKAPYGPMEQIKTQSKVPVIDVGVIPLIRQGHVKVHPGVREFTRDGVIFEDGKGEPFDTVILATGYHARPGTLFRDPSRVVNSDGLPLKSGGPTALPGMYFVGFSNSASGLLREIGREAKRIGDSIARQFSS